MIANCGMPTGAFSDDCVAQAFAAYRDPVNRASILAGLTACGLGPATIQMVGVWDTVGSLGIPAIFGEVDEKHLWISRYESASGHQECLPLPGA